MGNVLCGILWFLVLFFCSFWVAFFFAWFYIYLYPWEVCCSGLSKINDFLLKCVQFPHYCAQAMVDCKKMC